jgi:energy-coupling factor transport system permease protein
VTYLQCRNPGIKLLALLVVLVLLTLVFDPVTPLVLAALAVAGGRLAGGIPLRGLLRLLLVLAPAAVGIYLGNILFGRFNAAAPALVQLGPLRVTGVALVNASSLVARLVALGAFSAVFVRTTDASDLVLSLVHQARLSYRVAFGTLVGLRMLPLLQGEYATIRAAHRVRGIDEGRGLRGTWWRMRRYSIPLLAGAVRKAGRVALAMDARAFGAYDDRTYLRRLVVTGADWVFLGVVVGGVVAVIGGLAALGIAHLGLGA